MADETQPNGLPEAPKPPYDSPITYEIRDVDEIWNQFKYGRSSRIGPGTETLIFEPALTSSLGTEPGKTSFENLSLSRQQKDLLNGVIDNPDIVKGIEGKLRQYVDDSIRLTIRPDHLLPDTMNVLSFAKAKQTDQGEQLEEFATDATWEKFVYKFAPNTTTPGALEKELGFALQVFRVYMTEALRAKGQEPSQEKIIIEPPEDEIMKNEIKLSEFFKSYLSKRILKENINPLPLHIERKETLENPYQLPGQTPKISPEQPQEQIPPPANGRSREIIKKRFGTDRDSDLEGLRQSIVVEDKPDVSFEDIAGQDTAVNQARDLSRLLAHPELFDMYGIDPPRGILFHGPPGTGKTMIAKALANEANAGFVYIKATDLASKWYGDSEKFAKGIFTIAREQAEERGHCILYIDEVDSILPPRNGVRGTHEVTNRVIGTFLQEIDGLGTEAGKITVVASTNIPDNVDPAFLSRMSEWVEVPLPNAEGRTKILGKHFAAASERAKRDSFFDQSVNLVDIGQRTEGLSGRDLADLVQVILREKALQSLDGGYQPVTQSDILTAVENSAKTRTLKEEIRKRNQRIGFQPPQPNG